MQSSRCQRPASLASSLGGQRVARTHSCGKRSSCCVYLPAPQLRGGVFRRNLAVSHGPSRPPFWCEPGWKTRKSGRSSCPVGRQQGLLAVSSLDFNRASNSKILVPCGTAVNATPAMSKMFKFLPGYRQLIGICAAAIQDSARPSISQCLLYRAIPGETSFTFDRSGSWAYRTV